MTPSPDAPLWVQTPRPKDPPPGGPRRPWPKHAISSCTRFAPIGLGLWQTGAPPQQMGRPRYAMRSWRKRLRRSSFCRVWMRSLLLKVFRSSSYTDARAVNSVDRIDKLGLKPFIKRIHAPDQRLSSSGDPVFDNHVNVLPPEDRKPNPKTLRDICEQLNVDHRSALYLGDSLVRDVFMAKSAGVVSAWARYGVAIDPDLWERLVRVTHWTEADVEREKELRENARLDTEPDLTLEGISELLDMVDFKPAA